MKSNASKPERRHVLFKDNVSVRPITHMNEMPLDYTRAVWYEKKDFIEIKQRIALTLRIMSHGGQPNIDTEEHCSRGLEYRTKDGASVRRENKFNALNAVLDEQDRQRELRIHNDALLCQIYVLENRFSRLTALRLGIRDEEVARGIYLEQELQRMLDISCHSGYTDTKMEYSDEYQEPQIVS
jgi:hypothetical protein